MRRCSEQFKILKDLQIEVVGFRGTGKHYVLRCRSSEGRTFLTTCARTPSDWRSLQNWRSTLRRIVENRA